MLLHDMGTALADGMEDGEAKSRDWRTAPLIGLRFLKTFLHDSRATSIDQAIRFHDSPGSEASESVHAYSSLSPDDRALLAAYVESL
jgi:CxxC motif-containing protein (DUF1111 family)